MRKLAKCRCGKEIVFIGDEMVEEQEEEELSGIYAQRSQTSYGQKPQSERRMRRTRMYACKDYPNCKFFSDKMTESECLELEDEQSEE